MRLLELTTQATAGFSSARRCQLAAGYNCLVPPAGQQSPLAALLSALFYGDGRGGDGALAAGAGACVALLFQAQGGALYRLVRQLGSRGALQRLEAPGQPWRELCQEARDITSVLRASCGMPTKGQFEAIFCASPKFAAPVPAPERPLGLSAAGRGFGAGCGAVASAPAGGLGAALPAGRAVLPPLGAGAGRALALQPALLPPPLPPEEAQAIRDKLLAEIAAGKALDAWQFELEGLQQRLFQHRERLDARAQLAQRLDACQAELRALGPAPEERGADPALLERALHYDAALKRRDLGLRDLKEAARKLEAQRSALSAKPPWQRPPLLASGVAGLACLAAGIAFQESPMGFLALLSIVAFGYPALCALGWIDEAELRRGLDQRALRLKEDEQKLSADFERDYGSIDGLLRTLGMACGQEILADRQRRQVLGEALAEARAALARFDADPAFERGRAEAERLEAEIAALERKMASAALQTTRDHHVAESELKALEARQKQAPPEARAAPAPGQASLGAPLSLAVDSAPQAPPDQDADARIPALLRLALDLWPGAKLEAIGPALCGRVNQYWAALTGRSDRRVEFNGKAEIAITEGAKGARAPLAGEAGGDREFLYWSVRLALLEKLVAARPIPVVLEAPSAGWSAPQAQLFARALAHLGQATQVLHVSARPEEGAIFL